MFTIPIEMPTSIQTIQSIQSITVDDLSHRLWRAGNKVLAPVSFMGGGLAKRLPSRNTVGGALDYVNRRFCIGIEMFGDVHLREDARCGILFDLANLPLEMVVARLRREGAIV